MGIQGKGRLSSRPPWVIGPADWARIPREPLVAEVTRSASDRGG